MSTRSGGPKTKEGKAVTRLNAAKFGIYSVTPVVPAFERQDEWLTHHDSVFADLQPEGYMQEIIAERIALKTWFLRRLVRYGREQTRHRQQDIPTNLALVAKLDGRKIRENIDKDLQLMDRWAMDALIPGEKELATLMRWESRLSRELRLDMLHLEHMQRKRRERPLTLSPAAAGVEGSSSLAEWDPPDSTLSPAEPESLSLTSLPSPLPKLAEGRGVTDLALRSGDGWRRR